MGLFRMFTKFSQYTCSALRMKEGNVQLLGTLAWSLVNQTNALFGYFCQRICYTVFDAESDVMNTLVTFVKPLLNSALRRCGLQQL